MINERTTLADALIRSGIVDESDAERVEQERRRHRKAKVAYDRQIQACVDVVLKWCNTTEARDVESALARNDAAGNDFRKAIEEWLKTIQNAPRKDKFKVAEKGWFRVWECFVFSANSQHHPSGRT